MFKRVHNQVWAFDAEWVPDPAAGRNLYGIGEDVSDADVLGVMWERGGATEEDPTPYLKTVLCRLVSLSAVTRNKKADGEVVLSLLSLPKEEERENPSEAGIIATFLQAVGKYGPQLVGFNSVEADLRILVQRGIVTGVQAAGFCARPDKPWEGVDYFAKGSDWNVDLMSILSGWSRRSASLHEIARLSGIPGKLDTDGSQVAQMWLEGNLTEIIQYNEFDALTTYLVWLRMAFFAGHFSEDDYLTEQQRVRDLLTDLSAQKGREYLNLYLDHWQELSAEQPFSLF